MVRGGPGSYRLKMNESEIEAEIHTLRDGGLLMQARIFLETVLGLMDYLILSCSSFLLGYSMWIWGK